MKSRLVQRCQQKNSRGAVLSLVGVLLVVFIGIAALAIDIGYINTTKNELQNVADAAALAATGELGQIYLNKGSYVHGVDEVTIKTIAKAVGSENRAAGTDIVVGDSDIVIGYWENQATDIDPYITNPRPPNAVKVTARRDTVENESIGSLFAGIFGFDTFDVVANATAALSGQATFEPGEIKLPFTLSQLQFPDACTEPVTFTSNDDCAAWHTFTESGINDNQLVDMLYGMILAHEDGSAWLTSLIKFPGNQIPSQFISPSVEGGVTAFTVTEGTHAALFTGTPSPMQALFDFWKTHDDDGDDSVWTSTVPVYKEPSDATVCTPTSKFDPRLIVGAADVIVKGVNGPPDNSISVEITCAYKQMRGSGGFGGNVGTIPNLVE